MHVALRAVRAVGLLVVLGVLAAVLPGLPTAAAGAAELEPRTALVVDFVSPGWPTAFSAVYDSTGTKAPTAAPGNVLGSLRLGPPAGVTGPVVEVLPADSGPLTVGTHPVKASTSPPRTTPVLRLLSRAGNCSSFSAQGPGSLVVHAVEHDEAGAISSLSATYSIACTGTTALVTGELRYRSAMPYAAVGSSARSLGAVATGSRTPFTATVANSGTTAVTLGAPTPVDRGADAPRIEPVAGGDTCSSAPLAPGASCSLSLEYVDDGVAGGGYVAELRLAAAALPRGHVSVLATVTDVVRPPGAPQSVRTASAYDGVRLSWVRDSSAPLPQGFRVRRLDGPTPGLKADLDLSASHWADTSLAKGESATYEVVAYNQAGEAAAAPVTVLRQDHPDPPPAVDRRTLVMDGLAGSGVADTAVGDTVTVSNRTPGSIGVTAGTMTLDLTAPPGPGTYPAGSGSGALSVLAYGPPATCSQLTGTVVVREAWVQADGRVHRLDADLHLLCAGTIRIEASLRLGTGTPFTAVTAQPGRVEDLEAEVGGPPDVRDVRLVNAGTTAVDVGSARVTGDDAAAFSVAERTCGTSLEPGSSCTLPVAFAPQRSGPFSAALEVPVGTAIGTRRVGLVGSASGAPPVRVASATPVLGRTGLQWYQGPDGGSPVTGFVVQRATAGGAFAEVARRPATDFSWVDADVSPGTTYRYRLLTENAFGAVVPGAEHVTTVVAARDELLVSASDAARDGLALASVPVRGGLPVAISGRDPADLPAVSPDGREVAYVVEDAQGDVGLWLRPLSGRAPAPRLLVDAPDVDETDPAWSPDGSRLCYSRLTGTTSDVWCIAAALGAAPTPFPGGTDAMEPSWLPDGTGIVVTNVGDARTALVRLSTSGVRTPLPGTEDGSWPAVSPRGDRIAFVLTDEQGVDRLRTVGPDGGTPTDLAMSHSDLYDRPAWAPDGQALAVPTYGSWDASTLTVWRAGQGTAAGAVEQVRAAAGYDVGAVAWRRQDVAAPTITFPGAAAATPAAARVPVRVVDDTVPVGGLTISCTVDGRAVDRCDSGWAGTLPAGLHRLAVTARDLHGRTSTATHTWTVDTAPPVVAVAALPAFTLAPTTTVSYTASDASGVAHHDVRYRRAAWSAAGFSAATVPSGWAGTTARSRSLAVQSGHEYCFSVRARDRAGNVSAWSGERCTAVPLDDRALSRATAGWSSSTAPTAFAGTLTRTGTAGARLVRPSAQARRLAVVATTCPTCGSVDVLMGTTRVGTLSLASSATRTRQVLQLPLLSGVRGGTVTLRSTRSGRPVLVDGLGLRRT